MQEMLDRQAKDLKQHFSEQMAATLKPIRDDIAALKEELKMKNDVIDTLRNDIQLVKSTNEELASANKSLEAKLTNFEHFQVSAVESFRQLEEKLEDRTNRQLRQTIIVKGLPEKVNEKWADTRNILAKHVSKFYKMDFKDAYVLFERVHRGGGNGYQDRKKGNVISMPYVGSGMTVSSSSGIRLMPTNRNPRRSALSSSINMGH